MCLSHDIDSSSIKFFLLSRWKVNSISQVLSSYDASANHEPFVARGEKAHWAVIVGFAVSSEKDPNISLIEFIAKRNLSKAENSETQSMSLLEDVNETVKDDIVFLNEETAEADLQEALLRHVASYPDSVYVLTLQGTPHHHCNKSIFSIVLFSTLYKAIMKSEYLISVANA